MTAFPRSPNLNSWVTFDPTIRKFTGISFSMCAPKRIVGDLSENKCCSCCPRRHFLGAAAALLPILPSFASERDSKSVLNSIHPPRPDWYEEFYASAMDRTMRSYEAEIAGYKAELFANLRGKAERILEIGVGTGPNLKYYADYPDTLVYGVDPNRKMQKYAQAAATAARLPPSNFTFMPAVAEALPLKDASVDAVVGTLVLCSVKDVDQALQEVRRVLRPGGLYIFVEHVAAKDGTLLRFVQGILDPLQQTVADGCHLTRDTATNIAKAGFADLHVNQAILSTASLINPHVYGIAYK
ncbi:putative methyltransferase-like protein 7A isoform X1 [Salvia hispanica]|uniref:putative methyltransferase-like protein 7A isoform X1 n=1 Tax=Salvia hispanica TaxID=49212 RepID=UPI002009DB4D|nr:putative methyltransferase-like protein 7A isoform X1 [Salvia hispanica]